MKMEFSSQRIEMFLFWPPTQLPWCHVQDRFILIVQSDGYKIMGGGLN